MGQAKNKGNFEQRVLVAKEKINAIRPKYLTCNGCKTEIHQITDLNTKGLIGIEAGFAGQCPECNTSTFAFKGDPDAVTNVLINLDSFLGGNSEFGSIKISGSAMD